MEYVFFVAFVFLGISMGYGWGKEESRMEATAWRRSCEEWEKICRRKEG